MDIVKLELNVKNLLLLEFFFKKQFEGNYNYGSSKYFYWKIILNKTMPGIINSIIINSELVAVTSITPKTLFFLNHKMSVAEIGDTYTAHKYRGRGGFSNLVNASRAQTEKLSIKLLFGTPNHLSLPIYKKLCGFKESAIIKPYSFSYLLEIKSYLKKSVWSFYLNLFYKKIVLCHHSLLRLNVMFYKKYAVELSEVIPNDFNSFWNKASKEWDFIFSRDKDMLFWRFYLNPEKYYFIITRQNKKIIGYMVYRLFDEKSFSKIVIADYLFLNNHKSALNISLEKIREICFAKEISKISVWTDINSSFVPILKKNGFLVKKRIPFIHYKNTFSDYLNSIKKIHFTISDTDNV